MKFRNRLLMVCTILFLAAGARAQDKEFGLMLGTAQYQGDLTKDQITLSETKPAVGIFFKYYFGPRFDIKGAFNYGQISGDDANYLNDEGRNRRNLSFKSNIMEFSGQLEFNILPFISNSKRYRFAPYVFAGAALYHFNPKAEYNGSWIALQPLGTEGQTLPGGDGAYKLTQFAVPFGFGIKYSLGHFWNIGLEIGQRKLFTDYLDDVSSVYPDMAAMIANNNAKGAALSDRGPEINPKYTHKKDAIRGDPTDKDLYIFAGITISKTIRRFSCTGF